MISKDEVKHIANLARIGLSDIEIEKFTTDLSSILDFVEQLEEVDITDARPMTHITGLSNVTRADKEEDFGNKAAIRKLFPDEKDGYDKVKSVL